MTFLKDEQGKLSLSRVLLLAQILYVDVAITLAVLLPTVRLTAEWWAYQGTLSIALIAWAAGPRGLQYLGPTVRDVGKSITAKMTGTDNPRRDDERG